MNAPLDTRQTCPRGNGEAFGYDKSRYMQIPNRTMLVFSKNIYCETLYSVLYKALRRILTLSNFWLHMHNYAITPPFMAEVCIGKKPALARISPSSGLKPLLNLF
ncbi:MAG: hypothetical protein A2069_01450 [Planctomycetes bacterium GWB2_41_19]|nr:MAG: hypothetical protein A2069_01450 [Planctomycetes bacterium GWB2_41_19]